MFRLSKFFYNCTINVSLAPWKQMMKPDSYVLSNCRKYCTRSPRGPIDRPCGPSSGRATRPLVNHVRGACMWRGWGEGGDDILIIRLTTSHFDVVIWCRKFSTCTPIFKFFNLSGIFPTSTPVFEFFELNWAFSA